MGPPSHRALFVGAVALTLGCATGGRGDGGTPPGDRGAAVDAPGECNSTTPCPELSICCDGTCVDRSTSPLHCGGCGNHCAPEGNACVGGMCTCGSVDVCPTGQTCCGSRCADFMTSPIDCGACGVACDSMMGLACVDGVCRMPDCSPACAPGEACVDAACRCGAGAPCGAGQGCCGGACINTLTDPRNCGACGVACNPSETCASGTCTTDVPCSPACATGETCAMGVCRCGTGGACPVGRACCGGSCRDTQSDVGNCGACGRTCGGSDSCCAGTCINTQVTPSHCGRCNNECGDAADGCTAGRCTCGGGPECLLPPVCFLGMCFF